MEKPRREDEASPVPLGGTSDNREPVTGHYVSPCNSLSSGESASAAALFYNPAKLRALSLAAFRARVRNIARVIGPFC